MDIQEPTSIKALFQGLVPDSMGVIRGVVTSDAPLEIKAIHDDKLVIKERTVCLPRHLSDYAATVDIQLAGGTVNGEAGSVAGQAVITVHNALKVGDLVFILSFNGGKKYYVLDREA